MVKPFMDQEQLSPIRRIWLFGAVFSLRFPVEHAKLRLPKIRSERLYADPYSLDTILSNIAYKHQLHDAILSVVPDPGDGDGPWGRDNEGDVGNGGDGEGDSVHLAQDGQWLFAPASTTRPQTNLKDFDNFIIEAPQMQDWEDGNEDEDDGVDETYSTYSASQDPTSPAFISPSMSKSSNASDPANGVVNVSSSNSINNLAISSMKHKMKHQSKVKTLFSMIKKTWASSR
ncbi:hypothetical protein BT96DRAFT_1012596 [Gymnopus androsaceus JB14]|uniref:Uncharacterized protein n=1 Tax=Gymnopus androsaceus JB14 TaxID=1447944 RepID=A0A6A4IGE6_9AGAR|nr:hypothetical protein BT96DRAFT_1012596 [Gymnopus androsaceus JB14]